MIQPKGECDVCVLVHDDRSKKRVSYCGMCSAWLCDVCRHRYDLRAIAALKRKTSEILDRLKAGA